jgi:NAD+-dependent protein deacetylase sirtuin 5
VPSLSATTCRDSPNAAALPEEGLPRCPRCACLARPGIVWFGENLPDHVLQATDAFIDDPRGIDLILVIGTSAQVFPAASYASQAKTNGARVAVINTEPDLPPGGLSERDWFFQGDAATIIPELLRPVIGLRRQ